MKNLKIISTILLSLILVFTITTSVFADDATNNADGSGADLFAVEENNTDGNDVWGSPEVVNNETTNDVTNEATVGTGSLTNDEDTNDSFIYNEEENNETTSNSNSLAYTGIGDSNGMIALIVVISAVVAVYSAKKFNDYKNV